MKDWTILAKFDTKYFQIVCVDVTNQFGLMEWWKNIFGQKASKIEGLKPLEGTYLGHCLGLSNTLGPVLSVCMWMTVLHKGARLGWRDVQDRDLCWRL